MTELKELTQPRKYQAFGTVEGILSLSKNHSTLLVGETVFPVINFIPKQVRKFHLPGQIQQFKVFPGALHGKLAFKVLKIVQNSKIELKLKGCWENRWDVRYLVVYRNSLDNPSDNLLRILVPIDWENAPKPDGRFWEIRAEIQETGLTVIEAEGPFEPPLKATEYQPALKTPKAAASLKSKIPAQSTAPPLTLQEIRDMATPVKAQLTCKLNQVPAYHELPDKQIEFFLIDGSDRIFTVRMKLKMFKKLTDHGFAQWIAAITGELGSATETGFELMNASVQVFEKKAPADASAGQEKASAAGAAAARPPSAAENPPAAKPATARTQQKTETKTDAQLLVGKRKSLLDGVRMS
jgi:hypothetical protein